MGIDVNPPPQTKIPNVILNDDELRPFFIEIQEILFKLWLRTGGGTDNVSDLSARITAVENRLTLLEGSLIVTGVNVTVSGNVTVIGTAALTVTLSATPVDKDLASIKAINGDQIIINGNGKTVEGDTTLTIRKNKVSKIKTGLTMRFSSELNTWVLI